MNMTLFVRLKPDYYNLCRHACDKIVCSDFDQPKVGLNGEMQD